MGGPISKGHAKVSLVVGLLQVCFGLAISVASFVLAGKAISGNLTPYWAGISLLVPGILGVITWNTKNYCVMIAFMVLNIITFIIDCVGFLFVALVVAVFAKYASGTCTFDKLWGICTCSTSKSMELYHFKDVPEEACKAMGNISLMLFIILAFLVLSAITALAGSIVGCISTCCSNKTGQVVIYQANQGTVQGQPQAYYPPPVQVQYKQ